MTERIPLTSPRLKARIAGLLYVACTAGGVFSLLALSGLIVRDDPTTTARHIMASEGLYRAAITADLVAGSAYLGVTAILYGLLRPVSRTLSLTAALFSLAGCASGAAASLNLIAPLVLLRGAPWLAAFTPDQLRALAYASIKLHGQGYNISMVFFGFYCTLIGYLIFRSTFFPRAIGVLLTLAGLAWLTDSFATILAPAFETHLDPFTEIPGFVGEASLALWLLVFGLNGRKWEILAEAAADRRPIEGPTGAHDHARGSA